MDAFYEAYADYVRNVIPLKIWHVWDLSRRATEPVPVSDALVSHVDIFRKTHYYRKRKYWDFWEGKIPEWEETKARICEIFERHVQDRTSEAIERACLDYLWPLMEPCIQHLSRPLVEKEDRPYGCWDCQLKEDEPNVVVVHFANAYQPESPFRCMERCAEELLQAMRDLKTQHAERDTLIVSSWLNSFLPFHAFFPPVWPQNMRGRQTQSATYGIWGQYMDRRGAFHRENARRFRQTGEHPYPLRTSRCSIEEEVRYLEREGWKKR